MPASQLNLNGKLIQQEDYFNGKANDKINVKLFDPQNFSYPNQ